MVLKSNVSSIVRCLYKFLLATLIGIGYCAIVEFGKYVAFQKRSQNLPSLQPGGLISEDKRLVLLQSLQRLVVLATIITKV